MTRVLPVLLALAATVALVDRAQAQPLGTFRWQLQPYCNVISVSITQNGAIYTADGYDDQCGAPQRAPLVGLGTPNPDGSIGFGLNVVTVPGGRGVQIDARIALAGLSGSWSDSAGNSGTFAYNASTGGSPRPAPATGTTIPGTFSLLTDGGFLARGTFGTGVIPASNAGTRMMWHPSKAAFRAGRVTIPVWDDVNIGLYSAAFGLNTLASGAYSIAAGQESGAIGMSSAAFGENAQATGPQASAFGRNTRASAAQSAAFGSSSTASGLSSVAFNTGTTALGNYSLASGYLSSATGMASAVFGSESIAAGPSSLAAGYRAFTNGAYSTALGLNVNAGGGGSVVLGSYATAQTAASGTFIFSDQSSATPFTGYAPNEFLVRARRRRRLLHQRGALTTGVRWRAGGSSQWSGLSDVNLKHELPRHRRTKTCWPGSPGCPCRNGATGRRTPAIRHLGPTAQDFHAAFGLGEDPLYIGSDGRRRRRPGRACGHSRRERATNARLTATTTELRADDSLARSKPCSRSAEDS